MLTLVVSLLVLATAIATVLVMMAGPPVKPATERRQPHRTDPPPSRPAAPAREAPGTQAPVQRITVAPRTGRFRSAAVLVLLVVLLGAVVALVIAAALAALGLSLREAVT